MRYSKWMLWVGLVLGAALPGATALAAQDWHGDRDAYRDRQDLRRDHGNVERLRTAIARDQRRLNEDMRHRRWEAVEWDRRQLARDQWALDAQLRGIRHDRRDLGEDSYRNGRYR